MVVLNVKRGETFLFLYETILSASVDTVVQDICLLINGRLKVLRLADAIDDLANHGIAKAPKIRGLLEEQVQELKLIDEEVERCQPVGGTLECPDPLEFRVGLAPTPPFKELLTRAAQEAKLKVKNEKQLLSKEDFGQALKLLKEAVDGVYPMGLPEYDPIRMEQENREDLTDCRVKQWTEVVDPHDTKLWFASKELLPGTCLGQYMGKIEKTKVVVKVASKKSGQPCREPLMSEEDQKMLMMVHAKRREEMQKLASDADNSYYDAPWADQHGLKRKVLGLNDISWKPK